MKTLEEISRLGAEDLERIALDESIPVPEELSSRVQAALEEQAGADRPTTTDGWTATRRRSGNLSPRKYEASIFAVAAAIALFALGTVFLTREPAPKDTFDDPYLAYAEVEKVFSKISGTIAYGAEKVNESEQTLDKLNYWK